MRSPDYYHREAYLCRRDALGLALFAVGCAITLALVGFDFKGTDLWWIPLALITGILVAGSAAFGELASARHNDRLARHEDTYQPRERI